MQTRGGGLGASAFTKYNKMQIVVIALPFCKKQVRRSEGSAGGEAAAVAHGIPDAGRMRGGAGKTARAETRELQMQPGLPVQYCSSWVSLTSWISPA